MKKVILSTIALAAFTLIALTGKKPHTDVYKVDTQLSSLEWYAEKLSGKHNGTIMLSNGEIRNNHGGLSGFVEMDMNSIKNSDISHPPSKEKLENHLKSPDFFDAAKFPKSRFIITSTTPFTIVKTGGFTHNVKGNLTIKDKTNEISFDAIIKAESNKIICTGSAVIDRSKFDVRYGSKTFFADIGEKIIYDEFTLKFNVIANK